MPTKLFSFSKKYIDLLSQTKKESEKELAPLRAAEVKQSLQLEIAKVNIEIAQAEVALNETAGKYPLNISDLVERRNDLMVLHLTKENLSATLSELFS